MMLIAAGTIMCANGWPWTGSLIVVHGALTLAGNLIRAYKEAKS